MKGKEQNLSYILYIISASSMLSYRAACSIAIDFNIEGRQTGCFNLKDQKRHLKHMGGRDDIVE